MKWTILLIKKPDNGWYVNYIENKLIDQINKCNLQEHVEVLVFQTNQQFFGEYVSTIDEFIEISDNFVSTIYNTLKTSYKDCIGLKGKNYIDNEPFIFNNISKNNSEIYLPVTKLNPIRRSLILGMPNITYYLGSENLSDVVKTIDNIQKTVIFKYEIRDKSAISIIVTAYKSQDFIEECLDSIERQNYFIDNDNFEVLVGVDGCEETYNKLQEIKHKYRNLEIYRMSDNKGTYITTNTLINLVKNENVIRFDSDDIMTPSLVKEVMKEKKDNDIVILGCLDLRNGVIGTKFLMTEGIIYFKKSMMDNIAGGYMPWRCTADSELIMRLVNKVKIYEFKKALFYRREHSKSLTNSKETGYGSDVRRKYKDQIKTQYNDNEIKIHRVVNKIINKTEDDIKVDIKFKDPYKLTVIIPVYMNSNILLDCLNSILDSNFDNFNLLVINDSPLDLDVNFILEKYFTMFNDKFKNSEYNYIINYKNLGFIKTVNLGINCVLGDVIILNSDTLVFSNWVYRMLSYKKDNNVASITPLSNSASQFSFPIQNKDQSHYNGLDPKLIDLVFSRLPITASINSSTGVGFCMLLSREAITKIGVFDDVNFKVGYGEENDWCWRAINNGFVNVVATNVYISHQHGVSFSKIQNLSSIRSHNLKALTYKHPNYFTDVAKYDSKNNLSNTYSLLKFVLEFEYFRIIKKPVKLFIGNYDLNENSEYSEICLRIFDFKFTITCNDFLINKTTTFIREKNSLSHILHLLNPENIKIVDDEYFNILELTNTCEQLKKTLVTIEIPYFDNILSGGISRMQNLIFELPKYTNTSGGIRESLKFLDKFPNGFSVSARFQKLLNNLSPDFNNWTIGLPDSSFPKCDVCITYSDNPYLSDLIKLPQINKILLYMLSYGMAIERERANVLSKNVTVMCSTKKLEKLISEEGVEVHRVGFALNMKEMYLDANINRKKYIAIMYHNSPDKKYDFAVKIADNLYKRNKIDGVITFGTDADYNSSIKPIGLIKHYSNANRDEIREIFNSCICFIMPSISEGLNLTPVESTLCGCPAVICDGAIDELFFDNETCLISNFNFNDVKEKSELILNNFNVYSEKFRKNMKEIVDTYTWDNVIQNMIKLI